MWFVKGLLSEHILVTLATLSQWVSLPCIFMFMWMKNLCFLVLPRMDNLCCGSFCCSDCWDVSVCQFWLYSYWCIISFGPLVTFSAMWKKFDIPDRDLRVLYVVTFISMEFIWYMMCLSHCGFWKQQRRNLCNGLFTRPLTWLGRLVWCLKILKMASQGR